MYLHDNPATVSYPLYWPPIPSLLPYPIKAPTERKKNRIKNHHHTTERNPVTFSQVQSHPISSNYQYHSLWLPSDQCRVECRAFACNPRPMFNFSKYFANLNHDFPSNYRNSWTGQLILIQLIPGHCKWSLQDPSLSAKTPSHNNS